MTEAKVLLNEVRAVAESVAKVHARDVDEGSRFPQETIDALRKIGALSAAVRPSEGGAGASVTELAEMCRAVGRSCAASGMILAMHHIQVLSIERHRGDSPEWAAYARRLVEEQRLIASVTSEVGPGGNLRQSIAAVETEGDALKVRKQATTISYGAHADDLLLTARRSPESAPGDQVLVLLLGGQFTRSDPGSWSTLGMRGTCSPGAVVEAKLSPWQVLPMPFADVCGQTMVPTSHILWGACWLGLSEGALDIAAKAVRDRARKTPGQTPSSARALQRAAGMHTTFRDEVLGRARDYDALVEEGDPARFAQLGFVLAIHDLKLNASVKVVDVVTECLRAVGIMAYKNDSPLSLGRQLRDAHSAALMVNNDRIEDTVAAILLVHKG